MNIARHLGSLLSIFTSASLIAACSGPQANVVPAKSAGQSQTASPVCEAFSRPELTSEPESDAADVWGDSGCEEGETDDTQPMHAYCERSLSELRNAIERVMHDAPEPSIEGKKWAGKGRVKHWGLVNDHFNLTQKEETRLRATGFVVTDTRSASNYVNAYHMLYQAELPLFISLDSIYHALYASHAEVLKDIERTLVLPALKGALKTMLTRLQDTRKIYPAKIADHAELYLSVALHLLGEEDIITTSQNDTVQLLVGAAHEANGLAEVELFGRTRTVDWSQFQPRGHYLDLEDDALPHYFRGAMWLSRVAFNMKTRSAPEAAGFRGACDSQQTPEEVGTAALISDLAFRSGQVETLNRIDQVWTIFAGKRQDMGISDVLEVREHAGLCDLHDDTFADKLVATIGDGYPQGISTSVMPECTVELPSTMSLLGPRAVADAAAFMPFVSAYQGDVFQPTYKHVGALLGNERAAQSLSGMDRQLAAKGHKILTKNLGGEDLYARWLTSITAAAEIPEGAHPSYVTTEPYEDFRLNSMLVSYAHLRHNNVLMATQTYSIGGCEIPDAYVEPAPKVYRAMKAYFASLQKVADTLATEESRVGTYIKRALATLGALEKIAEHELQGRALSPSEVDFINRVSQMEPASTGGSAMFDGWYFTLIYDNEREAGERASLIADYFTSPMAGTVSYLGAKAPSLGFFVIDSAGEPRIVVGPVAHGFEATGPLAKRYTDHDARASIRAEGVQNGEPVQNKVTMQTPWRSSYALEDVVKAPSLKIIPSPDNKGILVCAKGRKRIEFQSLDTHSKVTSSTSVTATSGKMRFVKLNTEGALRVRVGEYQTTMYASDMGDGLSAEYLGGYADIDPWEEMQEEKQPRCD